MIPLWATGDSLARVDILADGADFSKHSGVQELDVYAALQIALGLASFSCSCTQEQNHTQWTPSQYFMEEVHWYRLSWGYLQRALYIIHLRLLWPGSFVLTKDWMGGCDSVCTAHIQLFLSPLWTLQRWNDITPPFSPWIIYTAAGSEVDLHLKSVRSSAPRPCWLSLDHI